MNFNIVINNSLNKYSFADYTKKLHKALKTIDQNEIDKLYFEINEKINLRGSIYFFGNGGSLANCEHVVGDFRKTLFFGHKGINIQNLGGNLAYLTAVANDLDFSEVFAASINNLVTLDDLIIYFSGSGNSCNLVKCAQAAQKVGIKQASITGYNGGILKEISDISIHINFPDMEIAEDCQLIIFHHIKQRLVDDILENDPALVSKYKKRISEDLIA